MNTVDFLPRRLKLQRSRRMRLRRQGAGILGMLIALGVVAYTSDLRIAAAEGGLADREQRREELARQLSAMPSLTAQLAEGNIKQRISRELGSRLAVNAVLAELGRLLPAKAALTGLQYATVDVRRQAAATGAPAAPTGPVSAAAAAAATTEKRVRVVITGITPGDLDVADLLGRLSTCPLFSDVKMGFSKTVTLDSGRREGRGFEVSCLLAR